MESLPAHLQDGLAAAKDHYSKLRAASAMLRMENYVPIERLPLGIEGVVAAATAGMLTETTPVVTEQSAAVRRG